MGKLFFSKEIVPSSLGWPPPWGWKIEFSSKISSLVLSSKYKISKTLDSVSNK
jgi:hypothetical protein